MDEKNIVAIYKKIQIFENFYMYRFIKALEDVKYDFIKDTIQYMKKGVTCTLYNMEDLDFTISDEKYCFSDLMLKEDIMEMHGISEEEVKDRFVKDCCTFIRFGILEPENEILKIVDSSVDSIKEAAPDTHHYKYELVHQVGEGTTASMSVDSFRNILKNIEENEIDSVKRFFNDLINVAEQLEKNGGILNEDIDLSDVNKTEEKQEKTEPKKGVDLFQSLIGLEKVKSEVVKLNHFLTFSNKVKEETSLEQPNLNMFFLGNPGTGKTSVARIIASMFHDLGYVKTDKVAELTVQDFVAEYVGQTAVKAKKVIKENKGGVIFIDEAYAFCTEGQLYAQEALVEIIKEMESRETIFIFAGYQNEMRNFIKINPGLKSRIGYYLEFPDYSLDELYAIFLRKVEMSKLQIDDKIGAKVKLLISDFMKKEHFGNGRFIDKLFDKILLNHANRCYNSTDIEELKTLTEEDISIEIKEDLDLKNNTKKIGF